MERHRSGRRARKGSTKIDYARLAGEYGDHVDVFGDYNNNNEAAAILASVASSGDCDPDAAAAAAAAAADAWYANKHVVRVLRDSYEGHEHVLQVLEDGSRLTAEALRRNGDGSDEAELSIHRPILVTDTAESIGMRVPRGVASERSCGGDGNENGSGSGNDNGNGNYNGNDNGNGNGNGNGNDNDGGVTIRQVGELVGMGHDVTVMDVRTQEELDGWTFADLVDYFEDESRVYTSRSSGRGNGCGGDGASLSGAALTRPPPRVLNQISLEFSHTPLRRLVSSPQFVRDLDWIDNCWPHQLRLAGDYPRVQYYCLTSTEGCYTDFHVDFGGTSVWYHVLSGRKVFLLIPPTPINMMLYEAWLCRRDQNDVYFPDLTTAHFPSSLDFAGVKDEVKKIEGCIRVTVEPGQTVIIPTGWIHAVYTPLDSIVFGGNFLHGLDISGQLDVHCLETRTRVPAKFRFPGFVRMMFYAGAEYLQRLRLSSRANAEQDESNEDEDDDTDNERHHRQRQQQRQTRQSLVSSQELDGLPRLCDALRSWAVKPSGDEKKEGTPAHTAAHCARITGCRTAKEFADKLEEEAAAARDLAARIEARQRMTTTTTKLKLSIKGPSLGTATTSNDPTSSNSGGGKKPKLKLRLGSFGAGGDDSPAPSPKEALAPPPAAARGPTSVTTTLPSAETRLGGNCGGSGDGDSHDHDHNNDETFRISISSSSLAAAPPAPPPLVVLDGSKRKRTPSHRINDLNSAYGVGGTRGSHGRGGGGGDDDDDDEWTPGGGKKKGGRSRGSGGASAAKRKAQSATREAVLSAFRAEFANGEDDDDDEEEDSDGVVEDETKRDAFSTSLTQGKSVAPAALPPKTNVRAVGAASVKTNAGTNAKAKIMVSTAQRRVVPTTTKKPSLSARQRLQKRLKF